jgi:HAD superfamily 5'-nucleotidase-like hydrolase
MNAHHPLVDEDVLAGLPPGLDTALLRHAVSHQLPPEERRVFVNRTLRMDSIRYVGFDLDWTLADYHRDRMSQLAFERTLDRLVERHGYPRSVLRAEFRADFLRRGLMMDLRTGMVVKMNRHRYVGRAYHGRHYLEPDARARLYRQELINPAGQRFHFLDTLFELPEVNIFSELVELSEHDERKIEVPGYERICKDVRAAIDTIHADGSLKAAILSDLPRYLPREDELVLALRRMALGGQRLLLITNSEWYYTDALCRHLFEGAVSGLTSWRDLFDLVIVSAAKPGFFRKERPFVVLDKNGEARGETETPEWGGLYAGGSREGLMRLFQESTSSTSATISTATSSPRSWPRPGARRWWSASSKTSSKPAPVWSPSNAISTCCEPSSSTSATAWTP